MNANNVIVVKCTCKCGVITKVNFFTPFGDRTEFGLADKQSFNFIERDYANATSEQRAEVQKSKVKCVSCRELIFPNPLKVKFFESIEDHRRIREFTAVFQNPVTASYAIQTLNNYGKDVVEQTKKTALHLTMKVFYGDIQKAISEAKHEIKGPSLDPFKVLELLEGIEKSIPTYERFLEE